MSDSAKHVVVIGGGPGGYPAAFAAAHHGLKVTLIDERAALGGVCLNVGCIPSKALLHVASVIREAREVSSCGVSFGEPTIDLNKLRTFKKRVIQRLNGGVAGMAKARQVKVVQGRARFASANEVAVTDADGAVQSIQFDYAVVATGSRPLLPGPMGLKSDRVMDSTAALELPDIPETMLVIGGGYIGLEMGVVYSALGTKVSVVERESGLLMGADRDLADVLTKELGKSFEDVLLDTRVVDMAETKEGISVDLLGEDIKESRTYDRVLVCVGRRPNSEDLGLEHVGVELDERGFIKIDAQRRTGEASIFAIGDVAGEPGLAHKASHEARVAIETIAGIPAAFDPASIPAVVFTDPQVAWTGLTETEAVVQRRAHEVVTFPWVASGRAAALGRQEGLTKLIIEPSTDRILGGGIVGVGAGDLISEIALAIEMGATAKDIALTIHPHPTMSETIMEAAELYDGHCAHFIKR